MRIAVMGAGSVGCCFGAPLALAGHEVHFIARGAHLAALQRDGLRWQQEDKETHLPQVRATDDPARVGPVELVLVGLKSYGLAQAAARMAPLVGPDTVVLPLLNGVDIGERLATALPREALLDGLCRVGASLPAPGVAREAGHAGSITLGEPGGGRSDRAERVLRVLTEAGIEATLSEAIRADLWRKFVLICANAGVCCLTRLPSALAVASPEAAQLYLDCAAEVQALAEAEGVDLGGPLGPTALAGTRAAPPEDKPSTLQDLERGKPLELETLHGTAVRLGTAYGVPTPVNRFIVAALSPHAAGRQGA